MADLQKNAKLREVGRLAKAGDTAQCLNRTVVRTDVGFKTLGSTRVVDEFVKRWGLEACRLFTTPSAKYTLKQIENAEELVPEAAHQHRSGGGCVMFIGHDRLDLQCGAN